jgi:GNAT superfamily N-acetyltransferase
MRILKCLCGVVIEGDDNELAFENWQLHFAQAHAESRVSEEQLRSLLAAWSQSTAWDGQTRTLDGRVEVRPLTPARADDFLRFFDQDAFMDNPAWSGCYCYFYHYRDKAWAERSALQNRCDKERLIRCGAAEGYLAYLDDAPIGWCHATARANLPGLDVNPLFRCDDDVTQVGSIVCFNIAAPYRGQGLANSLLDAACLGLRARGLTVAEAYPRKDAKSDARDYHGRLQMYLKNGFVLHRDAERYVVVRKTLAGA